MKEDMEHSELIENKELLNLTEPTTSNLEINLKFIRKE